MPAPCQSQFGRLKRLECPEGFRVAGVWDAAGFRAHLEASFPDYVLDQIQRAGFKEPTPASQLGSVGQTLGMRPASQKEVPKWAKCAFSSIQEKDTQVQCAEGICTVADKSAMNQSLM